MHLANNIDLQSGVLGGLIIGASSSAFMYLSGKTTGISGIVEGVLIANAGDDKSWTLSYFLGLLSAGVLLENLIPGSFGTSPYSLTLTPEAIAMAGLLTGFGTRLGSGCTRYRPLTDDCLLDWWRHSFVFKLVIAHSYSSLAFPPPLFPFHTYHMMQWSWHLRPTPTQCEVSRCGVHLHGHRRVGRLSQPQH